MITKIYAAFCGTGKTYFSENTHVKCVEIEFWKYKDSQLEYIEEVKKYFGNVDYIFISTDPTGLKLLHQQGYNFILVYPENELRNEYLDRYINRYSPHEFIGAYMKYLNIWLDELKQITFCNHIVLMSKEYLSTYI
jgi:hypothetical protein